MSDRHIYSLLFKSLKYISLSVAHFHNWAFAIPSFDKEDFRGRQFSLD